jgi:DNA-binding transcriptional regulator YiaG
MDGKPVSAAEVTVVVVIALAPAKVFNTKSIIMAGLAVSIPKVSIEQIKAARALLRWSQTDLANSSGVSIPTVKRLEASTGEIGGRAETALAIIHALEAAGVIFVASNGEGPGVRLRK